MVLVSIWMEGKSSFIQLTQLPPTYTVLTDRVTVGTGEQPNSPTMFATAGYNGAGRGRHGGGGVNKLSANAATDCFWFMKQPGGCAKGGACTYRHNEPARLSCKVSHSGGRFSFD